MALLITAEIIARGFFGYSFQSTEELSGYCLIAITFLGLCVAIQDDALFRAEFIIDRLPRHWQYCLELAFLLLFVGFAAVVDYQCIALVVSSYRGGYAAPTLLATPLYIPQLLMPLGLTAAIALLVVKIIDMLCRPKAPSSEQDEGVG